MTTPKSQPMPAVSLLLQKQSTQTIAFNIFRLVQLYLQN